MKKSFLIFILSCGFVFNFTHSGYSEGHIVLNEETEIIKIGKHLKILEDKTKALTFFEVQQREDQFKISNAAVPYYDFTDSVYWIKFTLQPQNSHDKHYYLELAYPLMDHITIYTSKGDNTFWVKRTGYRRPFKSREIQHRNFVFKLKLISSKTTSIYIRFQNEDRMEIPLILWSEEAFFQNDHNEQYIMGIYFGILLFMFIFNFLFFIVIKDRSYLFYIMFLLGFAFYQLTQNGYSYEYFTPEFLEPYNHYIPSSVAIGLGTLILFTQSFLSTALRHKIIHKIFNGILITLLFSIPLQFITKYSVSIIVQLILSLIVLSMVLFIGIKSLIEKYRPAVFFIISWTCLLLGGIVYALKIAGIFPPNLFSNYALQVGSIFQFILLSFGLGDRVNLLRKEKDAAKKEVMVSEERYKALVQGSEDIIYTLDENWNFITVNKAIQKLFKIKPENLKGRNIIDLIYEENERDSVTKNIIREKLEIFSENREPVIFRAPFQSPFVNEPKEMQVRLEYINIEGKNEILGKATSIGEDDLLKYFNSEKQNYEIGNYLLTAEDLTHRMTRNLFKYCDGAEITAIRITLREIVINAIEHGNLEITYDEKTSAQLEDKYFTVLSERQRNPEFSTRKVSIDYSINFGRAIFKITDEGQGFDHKNFIEQLKINEANNVLEHGRGIAMALNTFDRVEFNKKGNQVLLVKHLNNTERDNSL